MDSRTHKERCADLAQRVEQLCNEAVELGRNARLTADRLEEGHFSVPAALVERIDSLHAERAAIWKAILDLAGEIGVSPSELAPDDQTRHYLLGVLQEIDQTIALRDEEDALTHRLEEIGSSLTTIECPSDPTILASVSKRFQAINTDAKRQPHQDQDDRAKMTGELDCFQNLIRFVTELRELGSADWSRLFALVTKEFGNDLAQAIVRGRIVIAESPGTETPAAMQEPMPPQADASSTQTLPRKEGASPGLPVQGHTGSAEPRGSSDQPPRENELEPLGVFEPKPSEAQVAPTETSGEPSSDSEARTITEVEDEVRAPCATLGDETSSDHATSVPHGRREDVQLAIWRSLDKGRLSLAYQLGLKLVQLPGEERNVIPVWLLRSLAIEPFLRQPAGPIATKLQEDFAEFTDTLFLDGEPDWNQAMRLLLAAAALRPALLAPLTGASAILQGLHWPSGLDTLYSVCREVAHYAERMQPLDVAVLKRHKDRAAWEEAQHALREEVDTWCRHAPQMTMKFAPATKVWLRWQEPGGLIHSLLAPVRANDPAERNHVLAEVDRLAEESSLRKEIDQTDTSLRGRKGNRISAGALQHLFRRTGEAVSFARRWTDLHSDADAQHSQSRYEATITFTRRLRDLLLEAIKSLQPAVADPSMSMIGAAGACCLNSFAGAASILDLGGSLRTDEPRPEDVLVASLLAIPAVDLSEDHSSHKPHSQDAEVDEAAEDTTLIALQDLAAASTIDWSAAFDAQVQAQRLDIAQHILDVADSGVISLDEHSSFEVTLDRQRADCAEALQRSIEATQQQVEAAVGTGLLPEAERDSLCAGILRVTTALPRTLDFPAAHEQLAAIRAELESKKAAGIRSARRRLDAELPDLKVSVRKRIEGVLAAGDVATANDYIDVLCRGERLPDIPEAIDTLLDLVNTKHDGLVAVLEDKAKPPKALISDVQDGRSIGPLRLNNITGTQLKEAADMLRAWMRMKSDQAATQPSLKTVFSALGISATSVKVSKKGRHRAWADVETDPITDRDLCSVHDYGSRARGRYRVFCVWNRPNEEDLLYEIGDTANAAPLVVFFFGRMTLRQRRNFAQLCVDKRRTVVVVDDTLILYLCGVRGSRTSSLFDCTIPFTFVNEAYVTTASLVPPELFYGRRRERASIIEPMGTCFIFGGRQLGKTALLRDVARCFDGDPDRLAIWLDLKGEGIGYDRPPDAIWDLLREHLQRCGVLDAKMPAHTGIDRVFQHVHNWVDENPNRRLLLLLDEADRFLKADGRDEFARSSKIKALMDRTERRFKTVFAGLHNVQRATRLANHPLAHYGEPVCIGPLLDGGEWREARALIERPMSTLGFRFESPDLVTRILSRTNYYPSLIQLYCSHLLRYLTNSQVVHFDSAKCPPYVITSKHIDKVYESQNLRHEIRKRFMLTLELDPRYEVIAFAIALYTADTESAHREGFDVEWIWDTAKTFWPGGFDEIRSYDAFKALLDEMVGLGVLRQVATDAYALRSPNIVALLGTVEEIERELDSCLSLDPPVEYEASVFRSALRTEDGPDNSRRNPLTAAQESSLSAREHGLTIVCGTEASGLADVPLFIRTRFGDSFAAITASGVSEFTEAVETEARSRPEGTSLLFVEHHLPWDSDWLRAAAHVLARLRSRSAILRILFIADPSRTWEYVCADGVPSGVASAISLSPWHYDALRQWLTDNGFAHPTEEEQGRIREVTGHWPILLSELLRSCGKDRGHLTKHLCDLESRFGEPSYAEAMQRSFGLTAAPCTDVLRAIGTFDFLQLAEVQELLETTEAAKVAKLLRWAELLCLIRREGDGRFSLDPIVKQLLHKVT
jgi:hypothetical protein